MKRIVKPGKLLTTGEVARRFQVDNKTVNRWVKSGRLPFVLTPGGRHRYPEVAVLALPEPLPGGGDQVGVEVGPSYLPSEVAALFRVDPKTVSKWANKGLISCFRTLGGHRRFPKAEVDAFLAVQQAGVVADPAHRKAARKVGPVPAREVEVGNWIALDGDIHRVDEIGSDEGWQLVLTFESGRVETLPADYPVEVLRDEPSWTPGVGGGQ